MIKFILKTFLIAIVLRDISCFRYRLIDCLLQSIRNNCICKINNLNLMKIACSSYEEDVTYIIEENYVNGIYAIDSFTKWPMFKSKFKKLDYIDFSFNKIESIGDINNIQNLKYLNLSYNLISQVNSNICMLKRLQYLDLSNNELEAFHFDYFFCNKSSATRLKYLNLMGNKIKYLFSLDLVFIGLSSLKTLDLRFNKLSEIEINELSNSSIRLLEKFKSDSLKKSDVLEKFMKNSTTHFYLTNNFFLSIKLNFKLIYESLVDILPVSGYLLNKFSSIHLDFDKLDCNCNLFKDVNFLLGMAFINDNKNIKVSEWETINSNCFKRNNSVLDDSKWNEVSSNECFTSNKQDFQYKGMNLLTLKNSTPSLYSSMLIIETIMILNFMKILCLDVF